MDIKPVILVEGQIIRQIRPKFVDSMMPKLLYFFFETMEVIVHCYLNPLPSHKLDCLHKQYSKNPKSCAVTVH